MFPKVGLDKFTELCMDLGLQSQLGGALRKLGKHHVLIPHEQLIKVKEAALRLNGFKSAQNAHVHGEIRRLLAKPSLEPELTKAS